MSTLNCKVAESVWDVRRFGDEGWYRLSDRRRTDDDLPENMTFKNAVWIAWAPTLRTAWVRYYQTNIAEVNFSDQTVLVRTGRWQTYTTKAYINCVLGKVGVSVWSRSGKWYAQSGDAEVRERWRDGTGGDELPFVEDMVFSFDGNLVHPPLSDLVDAGALRNRIQKRLHAQRREFVTGFIRRMEHGPLSRRDEKLYWSVVNQEGPHGTVASRVMDLFKHDLFKYLGKLIQKAMLEGDTRQLWQLIGYSDEGGGRVGIFGPL